MKRIRWEMVMEPGPEAQAVYGHQDAGAYLVAQGYADRDRETFVVLLLNTQNRIIAEEIVSVGTLNAGLVDPRGVFRPAVAANAASVIIAHNHPSGSLLPSSQDEEVTKRLRDAGKILGIAVLDSIILGAGQTEVYSFRDKGVWG
jgi:DNA repair protein RadC